MRRATFKRTNKIRTETCPDCGEEIVIDHPAINGDDNDFTMLQGTCECGREVEYHADDMIEPDYEPDEK